MRDELKHLYTYKFLDLFWYPNFSGQHVWDLWWRRFYFLERWFSPVTTIPKILHAHLNLHAALTRRTNARKARAFKNEWTTLNLGARSIKVLLILFPEERVNCSIIITQPTNALIVCHLFLNHFFKTLSLLLHVSIAYRLSSSGRTYSS